MTVYLKKTPVGVGRIVEKKVAKEKFGATIDSFLGDVDAGGNYIAPTESFEVNLTGVKNLAYRSFYYIFAGTRIKKFTANDVINLASGGEFHNGFIYSSLEEFHMDKVEEITGQYAFYYAFQNSPIKICTFAKLKKAYAYGVFQSANFSDTLIEDEVFPSLEEIRGQNAFSSYKNIKANSIQTFSKIKKIVGSSSTSTATFGSLYRKDTVWNFPSATEFTGYIWNISTSYTGEIHFAAKNQAAIEACDGYANKWGFAGATIFFDL